MSDTPRTDIAIYQISADSQKVNADFARELERELSELRKHAETMCEDLERRNETVGGDFEFRSKLIAAYRSKFPKP